jgi:hypothetical protein
MSSSPAGLCWVDEINTWHASGRARPISWRAMYPLCGVTNLDRDGPNTRAFVAAHEIQPEIQPRLLVVVPTNHTRRAPLGH